MAPTEEAEAATPEAGQEAPADEADGTGPDESEPAEESSAEMPSDDGLAAEAARAAEQEAKTQARNKLGKSIKQKLRF
jgi:hypothetical protein